MKIDSTLDFELLFLTIKMANGYNCPFQRLTRLQPLLTLVTA
jgi:hypothetical protein